MQGRWGGTVVGMALVGCVVGGCSGPPDAGGEVEPSTTRASSPSATVNAPSPTTGATTSTTPTKVILPAAAKAHTEEGARAFASYFIAQADLSLVQADSSRLTPLIAPGCTGCSVFIGWADTLRDKGQHHAGPSLSIHRQIRRPAASPSLYLTDLLIDERAVDVVDLSGSKVRSEPAQKATLRTTLKWVGSGWVVAETLLVKS